MKKAIIFDMDGVLIDSEPLWKIAEIEGFAKVGIDVTAKSLEESVGLRIDEVVKIWHSKYKWTNKTVKEVEDDIVNILIREINLKGKALPGVKTLLETLKSNGYKIGLATSSYQRIVNAVLSKLDIGQYFEVCHSAEHEEYGKPHPAVFLTTAKKMGVNPTECLVFEDSLNGVIAAKAARMKVVAIPEKSHTINPKLNVADAVIESLEVFEVQDIEQYF
ncbi:MAG: hexitol phosphatase HxpB [Putridiphycobacter sp.]